METTPLVHLIPNLSSPLSFQLLLIGAGGHCRACIDVIEQEGRFNIAGIVDKADKSPGVR